LLCDFTFSHLDRHKENHNDNMVLNNNNKKQQALLLTHIFFHCCTSAYITITLLYKQTCFLQIIILTFGHQAGHAHTRTRTRTHTHTHTHLFNGTLSGTTRVSWYQKGKTNLDLLEQKTVRGSGISWVVCKSAPRSWQITMPASHHLVFYRPDALPAALKAQLCPAGHARVINAFIVIQSQKCKILYNNTYTCLTTLCLGLPR